MKARKLKKYLDTDYNVSINSVGVIKVSNDYINFFELDTRNMNLKYWLGRGDRKQIEKESRDVQKKMLPIWDKLVYLIDSEEIKNYLDGDDEIENLIPVYSVKDGKLITQYTDKLGYPNTTTDGEQMFDNTHFETPEQALREGISVNSCHKHGYADEIERLNEELIKLQDKRSKATKYLDNLAKQLFVNGYEFEINTYDNGVCKYKVLVSNFHRNSICCRNLKTGEREYFTNEAIITTCLSPMSIPCKHEDVSKGISEKIKEELAELKKSVYEYCLDSHGATYFSGDLELIAMGHYIHDEVSVKYWEEHFNCRFKA